MANKRNTSELVGPALDWAVAKCECVKFRIVTSVTADGIWHNPTRYSTDWEQGGPIIERENIATHKFANIVGGVWGKLWQASIDNVTSNGPTPLIAAMRCYVASKLGKEVEVPDEIPA